jgi:hypothetical protein
METSRSNDDQVLFESAIKSLELQITNAGVHLTIDSATRLAYAREIKRMSDRLRADAMAHRITWAAAAQRAQETRNVIMGIMRARSTPIGRAFAQHLKTEGYSLNLMIALKTTKLYGKAAVFSRLSSASQNAVYAAVVTSAGKSDPTITRAMAGLSHAGRGLLFLSLGVSVYNVATSANKAAAIEKELVAQGASVAGGIAGGALAGLACGPAAPICVTVGAFVGGALASFGTSYFW